MLVLSLRIRKNKTKARWKLLASTSKLLKLCVVMLWKTLNNWSAPVAFTGNFAAEAIEKLLAVVSGDELLFSQAPETHSGSVVSTSLTTLGCLPKVFFYSWCRWSLESTPTPEYVWLSLTDYPLLQKGRTEIGPLHCTKPQSSASKRELEAAVPVLGPIFDTLFCSFGLQFWDPNKGLKPPASCLGALFFRTFFKCNSRVALRRKNRDSVQDVSQKSNCDRTQKVWKLDSQNDTLKPYKLVLQLPKSNVRTGPRKTSKT